MRTGVLSVVGGLIGTAMLACGSSGAGSCTVDYSSTAGYKECINYDGSAYTTSSVQAACSGISGGAYSSGGCAAGNAGICTFDKGTSAEYKWTFTTGSDAGVDLQSTCTGAGGTFSST